MMIILGVMTAIVGLQADIIAGNRKLLEDIQYHVRKMDYDMNHVREDETSDIIAFDGKDGDKHET